MKKYTDVDIIAELQKLVDSHVDSYKVFLWNRDVSRTQSLCFLFLSFVLDYVIHLLLALVNSEC